MRSSILFIILGAALIQLAGCKSVGTVCETSGSTAECGDGKVCTFASNPGDPNDPDNNLPPIEVCLPLCEKSSDCGEGELCQIVFCSDKMSCQTGGPPEPPADLCGAGGMGGAGAMGGTAGMGGAGGMGGTGGTGGTRLCDSTATAFIKTIDPGNNFALTNLVDENTTNLPETWGRFSLELEIDAGLEGQFLQVGFNATASNYEPSGVFYDNLVVDPGPEYTEDFESLEQTSPTALGDAGWIVFANVFEADGTTLAYSYGTFPAPNGTPGFCAIDTGQGGPDQGAQQLVIYSDYDNQDQAMGLRIEANTFRERTITAADVGNTIRFSFDAKRGNINEGCPDEGTGGSGGEGGGGGSGGVAGSGGDGGAGGG